MNPIKRIHTNEGSVPIDYESLANLPNIPAIVTSTVEQAGYMKKNDTSYARSSTQSEIFKPEKEYSIGDYCIFENVLYKFTEAKASGEWDSAKVTSTTIDAELKAHTAAISEQNVKMAEIKSGTATAVEGTFSNIEAAWYQKRGDGLVEFYVCAALTSSGLTSITQELFSGFPIPIAPQRFVGMFANKPRSARFRITNNGVLSNAYSPTESTANEVIELSGFYFSKMS